MALRFRWLLWAVVAFDILLAALFFSLAVSNSRAASPSYPLAFNLFFDSLGCITPFVVSGAALALGKVLASNQPIGRNVIVLHRAVFWLILLRSAALVSLALVIPNESLRATLSFLFGLAYLVPSAVALINSLILPRQARLDAASLSKTTANEPPTAS